jgi:hypothetical protein
MNPTSRLPVDDLRTHRSLWLAATLVLSCTTSSHQKPASTLQASDCLSSLPCHAGMIQNRLGTLGSLPPNWQLVQYGQPNPGCWTMQNAPPKMASRLQAAIASGAGPTTVLCYAEFERPGSHDDFIVKVFLFDQPSAPQQLLSSAYFQSENQRLGSYGLPLVEAGPHMLYFIGTGPNYRNEAWTVLGHLRGILQ